MLSTRKKRNIKGDVLKGHINAVKEAQLPKQPHNYCLLPVQYFKKAKGQNFSSHMMKASKATHNFQEIS